MAVVEGSFNTLIFFDLSYALFGPYFHDFEINVNFITWWTTCFEMDIVILVIYTCDAYQYP